MNGLSGYFTAIQNFCINDGMGIRTTIFFAGCPLRCQWCSNPETFRKFVKYSSEDILKKIDNQKIFYKFSAGGITFSGGEATLQTDILRELIDKLYNQAINLAIETSGHFKFDHLRDILEKLQLIFVDIKHMDDYTHKFYTGISNTTILNNIARLNELMVPIIVRIPVILGVNAR